MLGGAGRLRCPGAYCAFRALAVTGRSARAGTLTAQLTRLPFCLLQPSSPPPPQQFVVQHSLFGSPVTTKAPPRYEEAIKQTRNTHSALPEVSERAWSPTCVLCPSQIHGLRLTRLPFSKTCYLSCKLSSGLGMGHLRDGCKVTRAHVLYWSLFPKSAICQASCRLTLRSGGYA